MNYSRWYDKYENLKNLLTLLEKVDSGNVEIIAQDFLQIIISKYQDKFDAAIEKMNQNQVPRYNRWYDKNYDLHTCIEFIKNIDDDAREELINDFIMSLLTFITNNNHAFDESDEETQNVQ